MKTYVYRLTDKLGDLIYVGMSGAPYARLNHHRNLQPWGDEIVDISVEEYPSRREALVHEQGLIKSLQPRYNKGLLSNPETFSMREPEEPLIRVTVLLPRSLVRTLDARTGPGRSRGAVCRDLLTDAMQETAA